MGQGKTASRIVSGHVFSGIISQLRHGEAPNRRPLRARGLYPDQQNDVTADPDKYHETEPHGLAPFLTARDFGMWLHVESRRSRTERAGVEPNPVKDFDGFADR